LSRIVAASVVVGVLVTGITLLAFVLPMTGGLLGLGALLGLVAAGVAGGRISRSAPAAVFTVAVSGAIVLLAMLVSGSPDRRTLLLLAGTVATLVAMGHFTALLLRRPAIPA
jgi:hypothetical protein